MTFGFGETTNRHFSDKLMDNNNGATPKNVNSNNTNTKNNQNPKGVLLFGECCCENMWWGGGCENVWGNWEHKHWPGPRAKWGPYKAGKNSN